jgi:phosphatidylinositol-3-phosphatase
MGRQVQRGLICPCAKPASARGGLALKGKVLGVTFLLVIEAVGFGQLTANAATFKLRAAAAPPPHVMVIVEENREYRSIIGSSNAPYINSLATTYASATNWYAVQHTSQNDYVDLLSGSNQALPIGAPYSATTLVDEQHTNGIPWRAYMESMPSNCFKGRTTDGLYQPKHNPFHYFTNYNSTKSGGWCKTANLSTEGVLPYPGSTALVSTLNGANAPDFVWITPNACNDMHGDTNTGSTCASISNSQLIKAGDTWLSNNISPVISSSWFSQNGIIIITWDEGTTKLGCCGLTAPGGHIATIVVTYKNKGLGKFTSTGDHYGTLAAIQKAYGLPLPFLGNSNNALNGDLTGAFG